MCFSARTMKISIDPSIDISNSVEIGSTVEINNIYFSDGNLDTKLKFESEITVNEGRNRKCKVSSKKSATKQKRKTKKRNQKMDEQELEATSDLEDELNGLDSKSSPKIPDNYMTGEKIRLFSNCYNNKMKRLLFNLISYLISFFFALYFIF